MVHLRLIPFFDGVMDGCINFGKLVLCVEMTDLGNMGGVYGMFVDVWNGCL